MLRALGGSLRGRVLGAHLQHEQRVMRGLTSSSAVQGEEQPAYQGTPTVFDKLITINVVDLDGKRRSVRGTVGQTLSQVLIEAGFPRVSEGEGCVFSRSPCRPS